jgi:hypothetical protein
MNKHEKFIINIKSMGKTKDVLGYSYRDAINYAKLIDSEDIDIRIYNEDEKIVYSKTRTEQRKNNIQGYQQHEYHEHHEYHHNLVTGESYEVHEEEHEDSYA